MATRQPKKNIEPREKRMKAVSGAQKKKKYTVDFPPRPRILQRLTDAFIIRGAAFAPVASVIILIAVAAMSLAFLILERAALIERTDDTCKTIAIGLSSVAIESITMNKPLVAQEYLNTLGEKRIRGLSSAYIVKFMHERNQGKKEIAGGVILAAYQYPGRGKGDSLSIGKVRRLAEIKGFHKETVRDDEKNDEAPSLRIGQIIDVRTDVFSFVAEIRETVKDIIFKGSEQTYYQYSYPLVWKPILHGEQQVLHLGVVRMRFLKSEVLKSFYQTRDISLVMIGVTLALVAVLVFFYILLVLVIKEKLRVIELLSITDPLTKIYNRKKLNDTLDYEIARILRYGGSIAVIMFDIDHFKRVNDKYGHDAGDAVLVTMADIVKEELRETDTFARWGGEEFLILLPDITAKDAGLLAERLRAKVAAKEFPPVRTITSSFGVTQFAEKDTRESFLKTVDEALYAAKEGGRNRVVLH